MNFNSICNFICNYISHVERVEEANNVSAINKEPIKGRWLFAFLMKRLIWRDYQFAFIPLRKKSISAIKKSCSSP